MEPKNSCRIQKNSPIYPIISHLNPIHILPRHSSTSILMLPFYPHVIFPTDLRSSSFATYVPCVLRDFSISFYVILAFRVNAEWLLVFRIREQSSRTRATSSIRSRVFCFKILTLLIWWKFSVPESVLFPVTRFLHFVHFCLSHVNFPYVNQAWTVATRYKSTASVSEPSKLYTEVIIHYKGYRPLCRTGTTKSACTWALIYN